MHLADAEISGLSPHGTRRKSTSAKCNFSSERTSLSLVPRQRLLAPRKSLQRRLLTPRVEHARDAPLGPVAPHLQTLLIPVARLTPVVRVMLALSHRGVHPAQALITVGLVAVQF